MHFLKIFDSRNWDGNILSFLPTEHPNRLYISDICRKFVIYVIDNKGSIILVKNLLYYLY